MTSAAEPQRKVLVLDDDPGLRALVPRVLDPVGCETRVVGEPSDFFAEVETWRPTHLLVDLVMPGMDGVEVLAELGRRGVTAEVIVTSGLGDRVLEAAERTGTEHGLRISGVLEKPFRPAQLRTLVTAAAPAPVARRPAATPPEVDVDALRRACEADAISVALQPQVSLDDGRVSGMEALVRWRHAETDVPPDVFVAAAEEHGLIDPLTDRVVDQALGWYAETVGGRGVDQPRMSVNVSALSLGGTALVSRLNDACERHGVPRDRLVVELTESAAATADGALENLTRLRVSGFMLALDDFGTGFSGMTAVAGLPFSELKIDRSFVTDMLGSPRARAVVESAVSLAHRLGLVVTAEGVEDVATMEALREIGCDRAQGFFIARPMPPDQMRAWLDRLADGHH